jgi:leader peptidase (prepilin peptidase)/N-methyltransferase
MIRGREGLGLGDVWLVGMIGAFTGWIGVIFTLFAGSLLGSICGIAYALTGRARRLPVLDSPASSERDSILLTPIPFGPFLAIAAAIFALFQPRLPDWYLFG